MNMMESQHNQKFSFYFLCGIIALGAIICGSIVSLNLNELEFKIFIFSVYILTILCSYIIRVFWFESIYVKILALLIFEGICFYRLLCGIIYGEFYQFNRNFYFSERDLILRVSGQPEEKNFVYLVLLMSVGFIFFWYSNFARNR